MKSIILSIFLLSVQTTPKPAPANLPPATQDILNDLNAQRAEAERAEKKLEAAMAPKIMDSMVLRLAFDPKVVPGVKECVDQHLPDTPGCLRIYKHLTAVLYEYVNHGLPKGK